MASQRTHNNQKTVKKDSFMFVIWSYICPKVDETELVFIPGPFLAYCPYRWDHLGFQQNDLEIAGLGLRSKKKHRKHQETLIFLHI